MTVARPKTKCINIKEKAKMMHHIPVEANELSWLLVDLMHLTGQVKNYNMASSCSVKPKHNCFPSRLVLI